MSEFFRLPHVVLIGERDDVTPAHDDGVLKIFSHTQPRRIRMHMHRKWRGEMLDDFQRGIGGAVIADDEFIGQQRLVGDALKLLAQKAFAVIGAKSDRDPQVTLILNLASAHLSPLALRGFLESPLWLPDGLSYQGDSPRPEGGAGHVLVTVAGGHAEGQGVMVAA